MTEVKAPELTKQQLEDLGEALAGYTEGGRLDKDTLDKMPAIRKPFGDKARAILTEAKQSKEGVTWTTILLLASNRVHKDWAIQSMVIGTVVDGAESSVAEGKATELSKQQLEELAEKLVSFTDGGRLDKDTLDKMPPIRKPFGEKARKILADAKQSKDGVTWNTIQQLSANRAAKDQAIQTMVIGVQVRSE